MNRLFGTGISILLLSVLAIPVAHAETRAERQLQLTHSTKVAKNVLEQPIASRSTTTNQVNPETADRVNREDRKNLSERDRLILERQLQIIIPAR